MEQGLHELEAEEAKMGSNSMEEQTARTPVIDPLSPLVSSLSEVHQSLLINVFVFDPLLSLLLDLLFYDTP